MVVREDIRSQLSRLVDSDPFRSSPSLVKLLVFCVDTMLAGEEESLKETTIGVACFGRSPGYDPKIDPIVRVSARRLRGKLDLFYENEGREDAIRIDLPKGGYVPRFERCVEKATVSETVSVPALPASPVLLQAAVAQRSWPMQSLRVALLLVAVMIAAASVTFLSLRHFSGSARTVTSAPSTVQQGSQPERLVAASYSVEEPLLHQDAPSYSRNNPVGHSSGSTGGLNRKLSPANNMKRMSEPRQAAALKSLPAKRNHVNRTTINRSPLNGLGATSQELTRTPVLEAANYTPPGSFEPRL